MTTPEDSSSPPENPTGQTTSVAVPSWLDQDDLLRKLWTDQTSPEKIAEELHRSVAAVMTRAARLGLPRRLAPGRKAGQQYPSHSRSESRPKHVVVPQDLTERGYHDPYAPPVPKPAERICLMCLKRFLSEGRHNRICPSCKGSSEYSAACRIPDIEYGDGT